MTYSIAYKSARIKLQQQNLREWNELAATQQQVCQLIKHEYTLRLSANQADPKSCIRLLHEQSTRLLKLIDKQRQERAALQERHREELLLVEQLSEWSELDSNSDTTKIWYQFTND